MSYKAVAPAQNRFLRCKRHTLSGVWVNKLNYKDMTRNELQAMADSAKQFPSVANSGKSDAAIMVLELMDTDQCCNNYCAALREVLNAFPELVRDELETELDKYI